MAETLTYHVADMRVLIPEGKVAEKNPERFATVTGSAFFSVDANGKVSKDALSIKSKSIDNETAANPLFAINFETGTLTLPEGRRGRQPEAGVDEDTLVARLNALRAG